MQSTFIKFGLAAWMALALSAGAAELSGRKVVIDPGHGGDDPGALGIDGAAYPNEKDFNLEVGLRLRTRLQNAGCTVVMTRTTDTTVSLIARRDLANNQNPNCFISIHCNSFTSSSAHGTETFWWTSGNAADQNIATKVQNRLIQFLQRANRGVKQGSFTVLTANPPTCLAELLFISNQTEFNIINSEAGKNNSADALLYAVLDFVGVTAPSAPSGLAATALSSSQIRLTWTDNSGIEDNYRIERATAAGGPWTQIASTGANVTTFTNSSLTGGTTYYYRVRAFDTHLGNSAYSGTANATTIVSGAPTITAQPQNRTVNPGATVQFSVTATGPAPLSYQWRKNGGNLSNGGKISGATSTTLTITNVQQTDVGNYSVRVSNTNGAVTSADAVLTVNAVIVFQDTFESGNLNNWAPTIPGNALAISTAQNNTPGGTRSAYLSSSTDKMYRNLGVELEGRARATFWIYDPSGTQTRHYGEVRAYSGAGYPNGDLQQLIAIGRYNVGFGTTGTGIFAGEVVDTSRYQGRIVAGANTGWFNLNASRSTGWHKFEIERADNGTTINFYVNGVLDRSIPGTTFARWDSVTIGSVGSGTVVSGDAWFDDVKIEYFNPPTIVAQPASRTNNPGTVATFTVVGTNNAFNFQWRKDGATLANGGNVSGATSPTLTVSNVQGDDAAEYDVVVSNGAGPVTSAKAMLRVAPLITLQPLSQTNNAGASATFTVAAAGEEPLFYQWRKGGVNLENAEHVDGANDETLLLSDLTADDAGSYTVVVSNVAGVVTSATAVLTIVVPPEITLHPESRYVAAGATVTFNAQASGTPPLYYQWRLDQEDIPGATASSLTLTNVQSANDGLYSCEVTNQAGAAVTFEAELAVNNPPVLSQIADQTIAAGSTLIITNSATDPDLSQTLTFSLDPGAPDGADIDAETGVFTWTPSTAQAGTNTIIVRVTDSGTPALSDAHGFAIAVTLPESVVAAIYHSETNIVISWTAVPGQTYRVQFKDDLAQTNWSDLPPDVVATQEQAEKFDAPGPVQRFYRVQLLE
jgi:N-acetylmuramoyl-L-alanine amidase